MLLLFFFFSSFRLTFVVFVGNFLEFFKLLLLFNRQLINWLIRWLFNVRIGITLLDGKRFGFLFVSKEGERKEVYRFDLTQKTNKETGITV